MPFKYLNVIVILFVFMRGLNQALLIQQWQQRTGTDRWNKNVGLSDDCLYQGRIS